MEEAEHSLPPLPPVGENRQGRKNGGGCCTLRTVAGVAGNVLEWYDFAIFGYFGDVIGDVFFPPQSGHAAIAESFAVFGGAFLMRPVGAVITGYIGDSFGRKRALTMTIFMMAFPTFAMGCLPSYEQAGWFSTALLVIVRALQGLSVGGQLMSSLVFTVESHPRDKWGLYGSLVMCAANCGSLIGGLISYWMRSTLTYDQLVRWGWRIPFLAGILIVIPGLYLKCCEDEQVIANRKDGGNYVNPLKAAFGRENRKTLLSATLVPMIWSAGHYLSFVWMPVFMNSLLDPAVPNAFGINSLSLFLSLVCIFPAVGMLSDRVGRFCLMTVGGLGLAILGPVMIYVIARADDAASAFLGQMTLGIVLSMWGAPMTAWICDIFPPEHRLTSVGFGYDLAHALAGAISPFLATELVNNVSPTSPGILYTGYAMLSMIGLCFVPKNFENKEGSLDGAEDQITIEKRRKSTDFGDIEAELEGKGIA